MSTALRLKVGMCAAGLSCLLAGSAQAQQRADEHTKPTQYADQDTSQPLRADQTPENQTYQGQSGDRRDRDNRRESNEGQRSTTYFRGPEGAGSNERGASAGVDHYLANCLLMKNQGEIELNQFAAGRAKHEDVKQFAQQMVQEHRQLGAKLERVVQSGRDANRDAALNQLLDIDRQIGDKCGQMTRAKLEESPEAQFDKCFVGTQIGSHMQMLAALDVISQQSSGELRQVTEDAKATVKQHLEHAEKLMKDLESADARQARN
jgi:predicted outer membrane protein